MSKSQLCVAASVLALSVGMGAPAHAQESSGVSLQALQDQVNSLQKQLVQLQAAQEKSAKAVATGRRAAKEATPSNVVTVDEKGAFKLPGGTTIKIGGYVKADAIHDLSNRPTVTGTTSADSDVTNFVTIPTSNDNVLGRRHNATRFDARQSRINITSSTPTAYGPVGVVIETDFFGTGGTALTTNSYGVRLRRAFGTFYGFLIGQEWTSFGDNAQSPELLDFNGPAGQTAMRQAQIRYTYDLKDGNTVFAALENPESDVDTTSTSATATTINHYPDLIAGWKHQAGWGHFGLRGLVRNNAVKSSPGDASVYDDETWGYGLAASGRFKPFVDEKAAYAKDSFMFLIQGGTGIGRYVAEGVSLAAATDSSKNLHALTTWGGNVGYQHFWADGLRSSVVYGHSQTTLKSFMPAGAHKRSDSVHANLIWSPVPSVDLGFEYCWGRAEDKNNAEGFMNRLQASAAYRF